jgi:hypothetical protein
MDGTYGKLKLESQLENHITCLITVADGIKCKILCNVGKSLIFIYVHILSYYKLFLYSSWCPFVMLDSLSCSYTSLFFLPNPRGCILHGLSVTCGRSVGFLSTPVSSTNKADSHDITEILLKVALNTKKNKNRTLSLIDRSVYITESPNIHCHDMKDPTQFGLCKYFSFVIKFLTVF